MPRVFDDDEVRAIWHQGDSPFVVVTFGDLINLADGDKFFAEPPLVKSRISCLGLMAKSANWFPERSVRQVFDVAAMLLAPFETRILYGGSMGGYAAIKFSRLFGASHVLSFCPQWSIDPQECGGHPTGYETLFLPSMSGMGIRPHDVSGQIFLFSDPHHETDAWHVSQIAERSADLTIVNAWHCDHHVTSILAGTDNLRNMLNACKSGSPAELSRIANAIRRRHPMRGYLVLSRAWPRYPAFVSRSLQHRGDHYPYNDLLRYGELILDRLVSCGRMQAARDFFSFLVFRLTDHARLLSLSVFGVAVLGLSFSIATYHQTVLVFDVLDSCCKHVTPDASEAGRGRYTPILVRIAPGTVSFALAAKNIQIELAIARDGRLVLATSNDAVAAAAFNLEDGAHVAGFSLRNGFRYLSAEPDGTLRCDRVAADAWERFSFRTNG